MIGTAALPQRYRTRRGDVAVAGPIRHVSSVTGRDWSDETTGRDMSTQPSARTRRGTEVKGPKIGPRAGYGSHELVVRRRRARSLAVLSSMIGVGVFGVAADAPAFGAQGRGLAAFTAVIEDPQTAQQLSMQIVTPPAAAGTRDLYPSVPTLASQVRRAGFISGARATLARNGVDASDPTTYPSGTFALVSATLAQFETSSGAKRAYAALVHSRQASVPGDLMAHKVQLPGLNQALTLVASAPSERGGTRALVLVIARHGSGILELGSTGHNCSDQTVTTQLTTVETLTGTVARHIG